MHDLMDPHSTGPLDDRLEALGRALVVAESAEPPDTLMAAVRTRRRGVLAVRITAGLAVAAGIALAATLYLSMHPAPSHTSPIVPHAPGSSAPSSSETTQTLAALSRMNRDVTPESLRLPTPVASHSVASDSQLQPADVRDPDAVARIVGSLR